MVRLLPGFLGGMQRNVAKKCTNTNKSETIQNPISSWFRNDHYHEWSWP